MDSYAAAHFASIYGRVKAPSERLQAQPRPKPKPQPPQKHRIGSVPLTQSLASLLAKAGIKVKPRR
jgi:hypothetical protein